MQIPPRGLIGFVLATCALVAGASAQSAEPLHWSSKRTLWDQKAKKVELQGDARVTRPDSTVTADTIFLDLEKRTLIARGNCVYSASDLEIRGAALDFDLDTHAGSIANGRVSDGRFVLRGERINRLAERRFQTYQAEYTTCLDCPGSWAIEAEDVDIEIEGYAYMKNVRLKIKDAPFMWLPYLIVPVKSKRQSGLLFPRLGVAGVHGFVFVQPFFWATSRSTDMTLGLGLYSDRGFRSEWEGRYKLGPQSEASTNLYYTRDAKKGSVLPNRWGVKIYQQHELPFGITQKLRIQEVSDNLYPTEFKEDMPGLSEATLPSDISFSRSSDTLSVYAEARRFRNLLAPEPTVAGSLREPVGFDSRTVQLLPRVAATTNDQFFFGLPIATGLSLSLSNFTRASDYYDDDENSPSLGVYDPGFDPVRRGLRTSITPSIYTTLRPWGLFSFVPSAQYRSFFYSFPPPVPSLSRGYLLLQMDLSLQLSRIYETQDPAVPKVRHLFRPHLKYSRIPVVATNGNHPFVKQVQRNNGYVFDSQDVVPLSTPPSLTNYFTPLGDSIAYGFTTQLIRRRGSLEVLDPEYQTMAELRAQQSFNLMELQRPESLRVPFSRLESALILQLDRWSSSTQYNFYPDLDRLVRSASSAVASASPHEVSTGFAYTWEKGLRQEVLSFERSVSLNYAYSRISSFTSNLTAALTYSLSDYVMPAVSASYSFVGNKFLKAASSITFQSPSKCWRFNVSSSWEIGTNPQLFNPDITLNLTGLGFGGVSEVAAASAK
jgi:LPS-assembly protein